MKQGDSIWLKCYSPVKIGKALTRIMKLDHMVKQNNDVEKKVLIRQVTCVRLTTDSFS